jgi:hypothetical protein
MTQGIALGVIGRWMEFKAKKSDELKKTLKSAGLEAGRLLRFRSSDSGLVETWLGGGQPQGTSR